ncbi:hypothetical protein BC829DRAFT_16467 [Chytridium lagenaria]|nr:hypothetical protein BC829DRAFT_16467 [Chytridium lagenaria]
MELENAATDVSNHLLEKNECKTAIASGMQKLPGDFISVPNESIEPCPHVPRPVTEIGKMEEMKRKFNMKIKKKGSRKPIRVLVSSQTHEEATTLLKSTNTAEDLHSPHLSKNDGIIPIMAATVHMASDASVTANQVNESVPEITSEFIIEDYKKDKKRMKKKKDRVTTT